MRRLTYIGILTALMSGCGPSANYDTLTAFNEINLISRDSGLCSCVSESLGDSEESVNLMNWLDSDKANDKEGCPLAGWIMQASKDTERNDQLEPLMESLGEEGIQKFSSCIFGQ